MTTNLQPMAHTESLIRSNVPITEIRLDGDAGNTLTGYAAVFNEATTINGWEGHFTETIAPGAFTKTLRERGDKIQVLYDHGMDPSIGNKPLGKATVMREDSRGLYVEVPLDDTSYNQDLKASLRSGALRGMSFRFSVVKEEWDDTDPIPDRTIREAKLFEFGPVTFPAYDATQAGIRGEPAYREWRNHHTPTIDLIPDGAASGTPVPQPAERQLLTAGPRARLIRQLQETANYGTTTRTAPGARD